MVFKLMIAMGVLVLLGPGTARAQTCPPDCPVKGGGSTVTDCLLEFDGLTPDRPGDRVISCLDGDPACDMDPEPGVCGFDVRACLNNADPSLPRCSASGVDSLRIRGGGEGGAALAGAIRDLLPTTENVCTAPTRISVPIRAQGGPPLGRRRFELNPVQSTFGINGLPALGTFSGFLEFEAGAPDPDTGLATVDVVGASEYIQASVPLGGITLCLKPEIPTFGAGVISCGGPSGQALRMTAYGPNGNDRDALLLTCRSQVNYTTSLTIDHNIGVIGEEGFTAEDCFAAGGTIENRQGMQICNGPFEVGQLDDFSASRGELILAPLPPLVGFPVQITTEANMAPCGTTGTGGMSVAIALTTMPSAGRVLNANNSLGQVLEFSLEGEPFSCRNFSEEGSGGVLVFAAPQLNLQPLGDAVTMFRFSDQQ